MLKIIKENKTVIQFLLTFGGLYFLMALLYKVYLGIEVPIHYFPDYFTQLVAKQSKELIEVFGYTAAIAPHPFEDSVKMFVNGDFLVRVVEGCNGISVIILFISFVFAFYKGLKKTLLFILAGSALIYVVNILRIALLTIGIYEYPEYTDILHGTVFPAIIYGLVFLLWFIWVNRFHKTPKDEKPA